MPKKKCQLDDKAVAGCRRLSEGKQVSTRLCFACLTSSCLKEIDCLMDDMVEAGNIPIQLAFQVVTHLKRIRSNLECFHKLNVAVDKDIEPEIQKELMQGENVLETIFQKLGDKNAEVYRV